MAKEVVLTPVAAANYEAVTDYIFEEFGPLATDSFIEKFWQACLYISKRPEIYAFADMEKQIRKCVVTKHNTIYFKEYADFIKIIVVFDSRQAPDKLNFFI